MTVPASVVTWFDSSRPADALGNAAITLGGTHLLAEFFSRVAGVRGGGQLSMVVPFVEEGALERLRLFNSPVLDDIDLVLITQPHTSGAKAVLCITDLPWCSCEVRTVLNLHAKVYVFHPRRGAAIALLGSHNLTSAATGQNLEAGLLISGGTPIANSLISSCTEFIDDVRRKSRRSYDSLHWPSSSSETGRITTRSCK